MRIIFFIGWFLWALSGWLAIYRHNKKHPGICWSGLALFALLFGPIMIAESMRMEQREKWIRGEMSNKEYFGK